MEVYKDIHEAYLDTIREVWFHPDCISAPRNQPIREKLNYSFKVFNPVAEPIRTLDVERNKTIEQYTEKELELYNSCSNRVEDFAKASKFWEKIANDDGTINSAYGYLIWKNRSCGDPQREARKIGVGVLHTPWEWCVNSLKADKDTRQAILRFSLPEHQWFGNADQVCTMHGNWHIRDNRLHFSIVMRSNDLTKGLVYDLQFFISLMDKMVEELQPTYPELTKGYYTHFVHSMHIYERDEEKILKMIGVK
jgi:thymidylate synthase